MPYAHTTTPPPSGLFEEPMPEYDNEYESGNVTALEWMRTKSKWFLGFMAVIMIGALFLGLQTGQVNCGKNANPYAAQEAKAKAPIATVGDEVIERSKVEQKYEQTKDYFQGSNPPGTLVSPLMEFALKAEAISFLVRQKIYEQKALEFGLAPDPKKTEEMLAQYEDQWTEAVGVRTERSMLQKLGDSVSERKRTRRFNAEIQRRIGVTPAEFRQLLDLQQVIEQYQDKQQKDAKDEVKTEARDKATKLKADVEGGKDFVELAKTDSEDQQTKAVGGRIDQISMAGAINDYGQEYADVVRNTAPGTISAPIWSEKPDPSGQSEGTAGYYLVKVDTFTRAEGPEFEAAKEGVRQQIMANKTKEFADAGDTSSKVDASETEIKDAYERASLWHIFVKAEGVQKRLTTKFDKMLEEAKVVISDAEYEAGFLYGMKKDTPNAITALKKAVEASNAEWDAKIADSKDDDERDNNQLQKDLTAANYDYLLGFFTYQLPEEASNKKIQDWFEKNGSNVSSFDDFPQPTEEETKASESQRKEALGYLESSWKLNPQVAWTPLSMSEVLLKLEVKDRYPEVLDLINSATEFAASDLQSWQQAQTFVGQVKTKFDPLSQSDLITKATDLETRIAAKIT
ncbi:MAG: peptidylprolyl isomerase, partial [bacterium]